MGCTCRQSQPVALLSQDQAAPATHDTRRRSDVLVVPPFPPPQGSAGTVYVGLYNQQPVAVKMVQVSVFDELRGCIHERVYVHSQLVSATCVNACQQPVAVKMVQEGRSRDLEWRWCR